MVLGWRKAFCTSIPKDDEKHRLHSINTDQTPKPTSKFGFFSNPSTPRLPSQPGLRCRTAAPTTNTTPSSSIPSSPKQSSNSPRVVNFSNPSTPKSPSGFSQLFKSSLRLSRTRCGICVEAIKTEQGTTIFTAECSHSFHFHCFAAHAKKPQILVCPVCGINWKELPFPSIQTQQNPSDSIKIREVKTKCLRVYNDDEPLMSPTSGSRFNTIPESNEDDETDEEFQGFFARNVQNSKNVDVRLLPDAVVVSSGKGYEKYAVVVKVKAPPSAEGRSGVRRAPIDLVAVIDVSRNMADVKAKMMKRTMHLVISSLSSGDRLSIVAFSASSKRLLPLRRMTADGRRSARRIVDALGNTGQEACPHDALKKAAKVIDDRREKNSVATIVILSNGQNDRLPATCANQNRRLPVVSSTRYTHMEIPVHAILFGDVGAYHDAPSDETFAKSVAGLLTVVVQDLRLQVRIVSGSDIQVRITAVYSLTGRVNAFESGLTRMGNLYAEEERELLVEFKIPLSSAGSHQLLTVRSSYKDPSTQQLVFGREQTFSIPRPHVSGSGARQLKNLHVIARAIVESRILVNRNDLSGAHHLLSSARALLMQSIFSSAEELLRGLDVELAELNRRRQHQMRQQGREIGQVAVEEKTEPLTPTSAWRAAERLAKVAIMRKSMNRVSDLHGFENARF